MTEQVERLLEVLSETSVATSVQATLARYFGALQTVVPRSGMFSSVQERHDFAPRPGDGRLVLHDPVAAAPAPQHMLLEGYEPLTRTSPSCAK